MACVLVKDIVKEFEEKYPLYTVIGPIDEDDFLTVYPPRSFSQDFGVDVYLESKSVEFWMDGYRIFKIWSVHSVQLIVDTIIAELDRTEAEFRKENEIECRLPV